ncbi:substrate-binding periplasmic protein [Pseudoalteromonas sp.]|uniref:substrate-binding periplasmic protein n=1 Tax=Pseudoalteromonas sp. TaxID=53249 RepID=UPI00272A0B8F|nr:transporter substrate-binding domain-containing protein [Pseudoalteromonas sp.]
MKKWHVSAAIITRCFFVTMLSLSAFESVAKSYYFVGSHFPAILEQDQHGSPTGLGADIVYEIGKRLGHTIVIDIMPLKRALKMVEQGDADAIIGPYKSFQRNQYMLFSALPFYEDPIVFYTKPNNEVIWRGNFASLKKDAIGVIRGWDYGVEFKRHESSLLLSEVANVRASFLQLMYDRVDLILTHPRAARPVIESLGIADKVIILSPILTVNQGYFGFTKQRDLAQFIDEFNAEFQKMLLNGEIVKLNNKYGLSFVAH